MSNIYRLFFGFCIRLLCYKLHAFQTLSKKLYNKLSQVNCILEKKRKEVMSTKGIDEDEEATVLAQLGKTKSEGTEGSSMVAQVIEANTLPGSKSEGDPNVEKVIDGSGSTTISVAQ